MDLSFLRTRKGDKDFHQSRVMFCIKDGRVQVAPKDIGLSHLEWFESQGWVNAKNKQAFLENTPRGFYFPSTNSLYCYKGIGFYFDEGLIEQIRGKIQDLKVKLHLREDTKIFFGPKDKVVNGREYKQLYGGTLSVLIA